MEKKMNSNDSTLIGVKGWFAFSLESEPELLRQLPVSKGIYIIKFESTQSRKNGTSDIAYIGKAGNQDGIKHRIRQYFHPGWDNKTNIRMKKEMQANPNLLLGFITTLDKESAARLESQLLIRFEGEHKEMPPFNKQRTLIAERNKQ